MSEDKKKKLPADYKPGLEGVIAGVSEVAQVNPEKDALTYRGYAAHDLAANATFTETAYLLLLGRLPNKNELESFRQELAGNRDVPPEVIDILKRVPKDANPMTRLRMSVSVLHMYDPDRGKVNEEANYAKSRRLIAKCPTLVAAAHRIRNGQEPIPPDPKLPHGTNFLYMLTGKVPEPEVANAFCSTMILYAEHGFNASTFAALVTASTLSDMYSCIASAIGTLKGPLHGGANEKAIETLLKIGDAKNVKKWLDEALARKEKIMGFGHRVYKKQDSRAPLMKQLAETAANRLGDKNLFPLSCKLEELIKEKKGLFPNVDYHCAVFYYLIGLPTELYTPIFAMSRMVGWTAHVIEQQRDNRLIRPKCFYIGNDPLTFVPIDKR